MEAQKKIMSITSQGQITIPTKIRNSLGIEGAVKALVTQVDGLIVIKPQVEFDQLAGSLHSDVRLSDTELQEARAAFSKKWTDAS